MSINKITGTTPPAVSCPDYLCVGKSDGNYEYYYQGNYNSHYFLQCSKGKAYCQACWPMSLEYSQGCNQCLYSKKDECVTTKKWAPATTFSCPDMCPGRGHDFSGNMYDPYNTHQYVACWQGVTVGCIICPANLKFNQEENACLYEGKYFTEPIRKPEDDDKYV